MRTEQKIQSILNKEMLYGNRIIVIESYIMNHERQRVYLKTTEGQEFDRPFESIGSFLKELQPVKNEEREVAVKRANFDSAITDVHELKAILIDNIRKVKNDPGYIKQATAINNQVNTFVNITKLQLDYAKQVKKMSNEK